MLALDDPRWSELTGGYRIPYDASAALRRLEQGDDVWDELSEELHHQGEVGDAAYAAVPHLVRIGKSLATRNQKFYGLIATIEIERQRESNPPVPDWLAEAYTLALRELLGIALGDLVTVDDRATLRSILGAVAVAKGDLKLGALISHTDDSQINATLEQFDAWSELLRLEKGSSGAEEHLDQFSGEARADDDSAQPS